MAYLKGFGVSALVIVFGHHFPLDWWEAALLSFGITVLII